MTRTRLSTPASLSTTLLCCLYAYFRLYWASVASYSGVKSSTSREDADSEPVTGRAYDEVVIGAEAVNAFTFVQVSDVHASKFANHSHSGGLFHLRSFFQNEMPVLAPAKLLITGDLVDSRARTPFRSQQHAAEWAAYHNLLNESGIFSRPGFAFDLRGNHDCYDTLSLDKSHFANSSITRSPGFNHLFDPGFGQYAFAGFDACPYIGVARPLNFFGVFAKQHLDALEILINNATTDAYNHTFIATHYPASIMIIATRSSSGRTFTSLARHVSFWLSGHLHRLVGDMRMYTRRRGFVELEVGDMKENAVFRLVAVDHDLLSFTDEIVHIRSSGGNGRAPVVLVTNPRDARFASPGREPVHRVRQSTHVRVLVYAFGSATVERVEVVVDHGAKFVKEMTFAGPGDIPKQHMNATGSSLPLFVVQWDPSMFDDGRDHWMKVVATDSEGMTTVKSTVFRVDGMPSKAYRMEVGFGGRIMETDFESLVKVAFVVIHLVVLLFAQVPLVFVNYLDERKELSALYVSMYQCLSLERHVGAEEFALEDGQAPENANISQSTGFRLKYFLAIWTLRLLNFVQCSTLYLPYFVYIHYLIVGPWFLGDFVPSAETLSNGTGLFYVYGVWFSGQTGWVPLLDTWIIALVEQLTFIFPLLFILAHASPFPKNAPHAVASTGFTTTQFVVLVLWILVTGFFGFYALSYDAVSFWMHPQKIWVSACLVGLYWRGFSRDPDDTEEDGLGQADGERDALLEEDE
ncbi:hypothetical protein BC830DRAFT_1128597 [Chytriomyces sp. MP71]|nr:hypothetical protein BC830DRAFT_1128597 [Chytriomyces sp. MP71]